MVRGDASGACELAAAVRGRRRRASPVSGPTVETGRHAAGPVGSAEVGATHVPALAAAALHELVAAGLACGVCKAELKVSDVRLECTSLRPNCLREYHPLCVGGQFGHLYRAKELAVPQPIDSKWRCMVCSDMCAACVPAAKIGAHQPFYRCCVCGAKAHQRHWSAGDDKICFYCSMPM